MIVQGRDLEKRGRRSGCELNSLSSFKPTMMAPSASSPLEIKPSYFHYINLASTFHFAPKSTPTVA